MKFAPFHGIRLLIAILIALVVASTLCHADNGNSDGLLKLTILHMNDPHAHYVPYSKEGSSGLIGGFGKARTVISEVQAQNRELGRHTLIFLAGDLLMGTPFSTAFKGQLGVTLMNEMQFDAMVIGNHDFDYGTDNLMTNVKSNAKFPLISANIKTRSGDYIFQRTLIKNISNPKSRIVVLGLTTPDTPVTTFPDNVKDLVFEDSVRTAQEVLLGADERDLVIALTHLGVQEDKRLAQACPRIDIIIGGHSHTPLFKPVKVNNTVICQAGAYAQYIGKLDVEVQDGRVVKYSGELISLGPEINEDPQIASIIDQFKSTMDSSLNSVIGDTQVLLEGGLRSAVRSGRGTNLGRLIAYNMAVSARSEVTLINGGAIRASLQKGNITLGEVYTVLPFPDTVVKMDLSGADIAEVLQRSAGLPDGSGGKLQSFGIEYGFEDGKVKITRIGERGFEPEKAYSVATNNFLAAGGDGYIVFKEKGRNIYDSSILVSDLLVNYIKEKKDITQSVLDSIER